MKKGIILILVISVIIEAFFLTKAYQRITYLEQRTSGYKLGVTDFLALEDKIWPYTSENESSFLFHPKSAFKNGPIHNKVFDSITFLYFDYTLFSCEHKKRIFPSNACRLALLDELEKRFPTLLDDENDKYFSSFTKNEPIPLTDKHLELMTKHYFEFDSSSLFCESKHDKEKNLEDLEKTKKLCYKRCRKKHSKEECLSPLL